MSQVPDSVLEYGFDFDWDERDVWKLNYPTQEISIDRLSWHFSVPFWMWNQVDYSLTPQQVMDNPHKYLSQYNRIMMADERYPIDVMENNGRLVILDGLHRLVKQKIQGKDKVLVRIIPRSEIGNLAK